ncbi:MAG: PKD domain-containing protein [Candidatus Acetothermia bacterium]
MAPVALAGLDVTVTSAEKEVSPGEFVSLVFSVVNDSTDEQDVDYELTLPDNWTPMDRPSTTTIPGGGRETIFLTIKVPGTAEAGDYSVKLTASYGTQEASANAAVAIEEIKGVTVTAPPAKTVSRETELTYVFTVENTGNITDSFSIEADSGHDWVTAFSPDKLNLFPGQSKEVTVEVYIPDDAVPGRDPITVTATSARNDDIVDSGTASTEILPPSPQAVGGELYATLPARLEGSFQTDIQGERSSGDLSLVANGRLGTGNLYFNFGLSDLLEENSVDWNDLDYGEDNYQISTGDVGVSFSPLLSKYGRGISASVDHNSFSLSMVDLFDNFINGGVRLNYEGNNFSLAGNILNVETEEGEFHLTESVVGRFQEGETGELELEAGYTPSGDEHGFAFRGYGQVGLEPITLEGEGFFIGPRFAGANSGDKGFRLSQTAGGDNFFQEISYDYFYETPSAVQTQSTMRTDRLSASLTLDLLGLSGSWPEGKRGREFRLSGFYELSNQEDLGPESTLDETTQYFSGSFLYRYENFEYSFFGVEETRTNHLSSNRFNSSTIENSFAYYFEGFTFGLGFSSNTTKNLTTGELVGTSGGTSFEVSSSGSPYFRLGLRKAEEDLDFDFVNTVNPNEDLEISVGARASVSGGEMILEGSLDFAYEYNLPLEFIITKGRIDGYVFVDKNGNGKKDEDEPGVTDLVLAVENTKVATGEDGYFKSTPFIPGTYELTLENLPPKYGVDIELPQEVEVEKGVTTSVPIPLSELSEISVKVFSDDNRNAARDSGEGGVSDVAVTLTGEGVEEQRVTKDEGEINFRGLYPGKYSVNLNEDTLPPRSEITTDNQEVTIDLEGGETEEILIGNFQRPRRIIFGQPPEADFTFSPEQPKVGDQVNFSGGLSEDPDGEVTEYNWDFQSDGEVDKTGKIVSHSFARPALYEITLTVLDNDGNEATVTREVEVVEDG